MQNLGKKGPPRDITTCPQQRPSIWSHLASLPPATSAAAQRWGWGEGTALRAHTTCGAAIPGGCCAAGYVVIWIVIWSSIRG